MSLYKTLTKDGQKVLNTKKLQYEFNKSILVMLQKEQASSVFTKYSFKSSKHIRTFFKSLERRMKAEEYIAPHKEKYDALVKSLSSLDNRPCSAINWGSLMKRVDPDVFPVDMELDDDAPASNDQQSDHDTSGEHSTSAPHPAPPIVQSTVPLKRSVIPTHPIAPSKIHYRPPTQPFQNRPLFMPTQINRMIRPAMSVLSPQMMSTSSCPKKIGYIYQAAEKYKMAKEGEKSAIAKDLGESRRTLGRWVNLNITAEEAEACKNMDSREFSRRYR